MRDKSAYRSSAIPFPHSTFGQATVWWTRESLGRRHRRDLQQEVAIDTSRQRAEGRGASEL